MSTEYDTIKARIGAASTNMPAPIEETFSERVDRERKESHARYLDLYKGVAKHLEGWTVKVDNLEVDNCYRYKIIDGKGHALSLDFGRYSVQRGKVHVSGYWPLKGEHGFSSPSDVRETSPSVNIALDKGHEKIAKDITRRFLPDYFRVYAKIEEKIAADNAYADRKGQNWRRMVDAGLITNPRERSGGDPCGDARVKGQDGYNYDAGYGTVTMSGENSVTIELRSLPVDTAIRVLKALKGESA